MDKDYLNKKWLAGTLTPEEKKAFDLLEDNELLKQIVNKAPAFSASHFSEAQDYSILKAKITSKNSLNNIRKWISPMLRIAGVFVVALGISFLFFLNNATHFETGIAEKRMVELPDASQVTLNAVSKITFNKETWAEKRALTLDGEAFFKVAKGSAFDVNTSIGKVTVVGTQFNVKNRKNLFEVNCFEGEVTLTYKNKTWQVLPGNLYTIIDGKVNSITVNNKNTPLWMHNTSYFKKVPFHEVIEELERQYKVEISSNLNDENVLFTGGFTHDNLKEALKSITVPLKLKYVMVSSNKISLHNSE